MYKISGEPLIARGIFLLLFRRKTPRLVIVHDSFDVARQCTSFKRTSHRSKAGEGGKGDGVPPRWDCIDIAARHNERVGVVQKPRCLSIGCDRGYTWPVQQPADRFGCGDLSGTGRSSRHKHSNEYLRTPDPALPAFGVPGR